MPSDAILRILGSRWLRSVSLAAPSGLAFLEKLSREPIYFLDLLAAGRWHAAFLQIRFARLQVSTICNGLSSRDERVLWRRRPLHGRALLCGRHVGHEKHGPDRNATHGDDYWIRSHLTMLLEVGAKNSFPFHGASRRPPGRFQHGDPPVRFPAPLGNHSPDDGCTPARL